VAGQRESEGQRFMSAFTDRVIVVTGASSGIGEELARQLGKEGAKLVLCARRRELLEKLASEMGEENVLVEACDVTRDGDLERVVEHARIKFGRIDVVFANAGFGVAGKIEQLDISDYRRQFETNVFGLLRTVYATLDELKKTRGKLVLVGSVAGWASLPGASPYAMSKFAVRALANAITPELRAAGVTVTLISPGFVDSNIRRVDNQEKYHSDVKDPIPAWIRVPTDKAVREILHAVARGKREQIVTGHGKIIVLVQRLFPWIIRLSVSRGLRGRAQPN
jgi:uncharacterized protein